MASLENLPPEMFQEIGSYLYFFDKKSLAVTSKQCHALLGLVRCPDRLSWIVYVCRSSQTQPYFQKFPLNPFTVQAELKALDKRLLQSYGYRNWHYRKYESDQVPGSTHSSLDFDEYHYEPLLDDYFRWENHYPKWMLLHFYLINIRSHALRLDYDLDVPYYRDGSVSAIDWFCAWADIADGCEHRIKKLKCSEGVDVKKNRRLVGTCAQ